MRQRDVKPLVMGIVNVTPDSFSGDGLLSQEAYAEKALAYASHMIESGADILDIGGESSRPGSTPVSLDEELRRVMPVIKTIRQKFPEQILAIDTVKAGVAEEALRNGVSIVNDITALSKEPRMIDVVKEHQARVVLMHNRSVLGEVAQDQTAGQHFKGPAYKNVVDDVYCYLRKRARDCMEAGIEEDKIILDPGVGFGKTPAQNIVLIKELQTLVKLGFPVLMGVSRKSFIGLTLNSAVDDRLEGTAACVTACVLNGAHILRVHDVAFLAKVIAMAKAIRDA